MGAAWSEMQFEVHHGFISQKLKKLKEEESLPFFPTSSADSLKQSYLPPRGWNLFSDVFPKYNTRHIFFVQMGYTFRYHQNSNFGKENRI